MLLPLEQTENTILTGNTKLSARGTIFVTVTYFAQEEIGYAVIAREICRKTILFNQISQVLILLTTIAGNSCLGNRSLSRHDKKG